MRKAIVGILTVLSGPAWADPVVIAALGDSLTQGHGLPQEDGFVPQLESWLREQGADVQVMNAGVSGDTTAGGLSRAAWTLTPDVDAMIVTLGGNDLLRGIDPANSRADVKVLLVGMQAPGNYGPEYKASFDAMYPELAEQYGTLYASSFFEGMGGADTDPAAVRGLMQADGIHPNAEGVQKVVEGLGPQVLKLIGQVPSG